jgi:hypothetical protein
MRIGEDYLISSFYVRQEMSTMDILADKYNRVYDENTGELDDNLLWQRLKEEYNECPEY